MSPLWLPVIGLFAFHALWVLFIAVMGLKRVRDAGQLSKTALVLGYPVLLVGRVLDAFGNLLLTFVLAELPLEWTVTARLKRHIRESQGW